MPLVVGAAPHEHEDLTDAQQRARKVKPQYARGAVAKVAMGRNQAEAEMIQGILLEEGIPSVLQRMRGFDVPDFLAAILAVLVAILGLSLLLLQISS